MTEFRTDWHITSLDPVRFRMINSLFENDEEIENTIKFSSNTGLKTRTLRSSSDLWINDNKFLEVGEVYLMLDFFPNGRSKKDYSEMTISILSGIKGLVELINLIDNETTHPIRTIAGYTNLEMSVLLVQKLGFLVASGITPDGKIDINQRSYQVVGEIKDIKTKLSEFIDSDRFKKLERRHRRENMINVG
jgi:hypothetical protein